MLKLCQRDNWFMRYTADAHARIRRLFFAKTISQKVLRLNYEVMLMDCTYKTNTYCMPLCIISGVIALNTTFYIAFCFLSEETTEDYGWLLERLKELYILLDILDLTVVVTDAETSLIAAIPIVFIGIKYLLCIWHINKNIVVHCKKWYQHDEDWKEFYAAWQTVLYSDTVQKFEENWALMQFKFEDNTVLLYYLEYKIIIPYKEKIIRCFTNQIYHFGNMATSRSENQNARLKREL